MLAQATDLSLVERYGALGILAILLLVITPALLIKGIPYVLKALGEILREERDAFERRNAAVVNAVKEDREAFERRNNAVIAALEKLGQSNVAVIKEQTQVLAEKLGEIHRRQDTVCRQPNGPRP